MTTPPPARVQHEGPIHRLVVEEALQLLGYTRREVVALQLDDRWVQVLTRRTRPGGADVEHRHVITP